MKERNELARAITELPDDLLLEGEQTMKPGRIIRFRRLIAAAAVIAMLAVTVGAVSAGITWSRSKETVEDVAEKFGNLAWKYYKDYDGSQSFEKLELSIPLEVVELPEQNMARLKGLVRSRWKLSGQPDDAKVMDFYLQNYKGHCIFAETPRNSFGSLTDVENLLGITLDVPDALRRAIQTESEDDTTMVWVRLYAETAAAQTAETKEAPEPTKVEITFQLTGYATNGQATGRITVPLTEAAAREGMEVLFYSYESEGAIWQEEQTIGGYPVTIFGNDPTAGFDGSSGAVYTSGGIGYHIGGRRDADIPYYSPDWPYYDSAKEMVLSLLENSK